MKVYRQLAVYAVQSVGRLMLQHSQMQIDVPVFIPFHHSVARSWKHYVISSHHVISHSH